MDIAIIHDNGWSITNKGDRSSRLSDNNDGTYSRYHTFHTENVFNCEGALSKGDKANVIFNDGTGWYCDIMLVNKGVIKGQKIKDLTVKEIKQLKDGIITR